MGKESKNRTHASPQRAKDTKGQGNKTCLFIRSLDHLLGMPEDPEEMFFSCGKNEMGIIIVYLTELKLTEKIKPVNSQPPTYECPYI